MMEEKRTLQQLPSITKRDFFIKEKQNEIKNLFEKKKENGTVYENILYPNIDIREISERKNNTLLISAEIINKNEQGKYIEINGEKFYELKKGGNWEPGNYFYIDKDKNRTAVFHIGKIIGIEELYNKKYAQRNGQSMRKNGSIHTGNAMIDVE